MYITPDAMVALTADRRRRLLDEAAGAAARRTGARTPRRARLRIHRRSVELRGADELG
jgi:hypothetical protein